MMENYLRLGLLLIAAVVIFLILFEAWHRRRHLKMMSNHTESIEPIVSSRIESTEVIETHQEPTLSSEVSEPAAQEEDSVNNIMMISVLAKNGTQFVSYDLLQAISATGLEFGNMNLFHYHQTVAGEKIKLFSLASATKSGEFNLDQIGDLACKGLILFLDLDAVPDSSIAFDAMLTAAEQLADDLDGEMRADLHTPWSGDVLKNYQQRILQHRMAALA